MTVLARTGPAVRAWRPAPAIVVSFLLHGAAVAALAVSPRLWPWILAAVAANHLVLFAAVFWPRGRLLGPNLVRLPAAAAARNLVSLTFDDGPDPEVTPRVLDLLDRYGMRASFFCVGEKAAAHPEVVREIARRGHGVENHSRGHSWAFAFYGLVRLRREIETAQSLIGAAAGRAPSYFRAPMGLRSPLLDPVLARCGLHHVSWTRRGFDATMHDPGGVLQRLTAGLAAGDILLLHDRGDTRTRDGTPVVLAVLPPLLQRLKSQGLTSVTLAEGLADGPAR
jgi:peptidoglycan/xylan/chitin deacetylase (PgdA/CDA1 family)